MTFSPMIPVIIIYILAAGILAFLVFCIMNKKFRKLKVFRRIAIVALIVLSLARPGIGRSNVERELSDTNVFFVIDNPGSMVV